MTRCTAAGGEQLCVQPLEGLGRAIVGAEAEHEAPAMLDEASQFLLTGRGGAAPSPSLALSTILPPICREPIDTNPR